MSSTRPLDSVRKPLEAEMRKRAKSSSDSVAFDAVEFDMMKLLTKLSDLERKIVVEDGKR